MIGQGRADTGRTAFGVFLAVLATLPGLAARYPAMSDYPAHLARWAIMLDGGRDPDLARWYSFEWQWVPNLGVDLLIGPLAALAGLEGAGRIVVMAIPLLTGLALLMVDRALGRRLGAGTVLAFATIWSPALLMGFVNFTLAVALGLFAYALWIRSAGRRWRGFAFLPIGILLWLCHLSGWGMLGVLVFSWEWDRRAQDAGQFRAFVQAIPATWPLWPPLALTLLLGTGGPNTFVYGDAFVMDKLANWVMALYDQSPALDLALVGLLLVAPVLALLRGRFDWRVGRAALIFALLSFVMPRHLGGGDFADYRLVPLALMAWCLAIRLEGRGWLLALAAVPFAVRLALTTQAWVVSSRQTAEALGALDHIPRGARVAAAVAQDHWHDTALLHVPSYAAIRRSALVNSHFAIPGVHMLHLRTESAASFSDPSQLVRASPGSPIDLSNFAPATRTEWLWYIGPREPARLPAGAQVVWRSSASTDAHSLLAHLANSPTPR